MATSNDTSKMITIPLTKGQVTVIDAIDADLAELKWCALFSPNYAGGGKFLAVRRPCLNGKQYTEYLHRTILSRIVGRDLIRTELADHIDLDTLNNCRSNLRLATYSQNQMNKKIRSDNSSGVKGLYWHKPTGKWVAKVSVDGKQKTIGHFDDLTEARRALYEAAAYHYGEFARFE